MWPWEGQHDDDYVAGIWGGLTVCQHHTKHLTKMFILQTRKQAGVPCPGLYRRGTGAEILAQKPPS